MPTGATIVWFRLDLRLTDNPALEAARLRGGPIIPVFIWAPEEEHPWSPGAASRWWLHHSLAALDADLRARGSRLILRRGPSLQTLQALLRETGAEAVYWNRRYEPALIARDTQIKAALSAQSFNSALLVEPWEMKTYRVFTPFWRAVLAKGISVDRIPPAPRNLPTPANWPKSLPLEELELLPKIDWAAGLRAAWQPGEAGAQEQLRRFVKAAVTRYTAERDRPDLPATSRLSPHLHFGEIGPRQVWAAVAPIADSSGWGFLRQLGWREFAHHLLYHFPHTTDQPMRPEFEQFPWQTDPERLRAWQRGRTGFPLVDAGMRELWTTGWMHNRVRMVVASFLVKDLLIPWQEGARWFWDTLVDADLANNTLGWQWTAGCGADAAPYFRVFNPASQAEKFDPHGEYVRRWVPEAGTPDYPLPIVDHDEARRRALQAFERLPRSSKEVSA